MVRIYEEGRCLGHGMRLGRGDGLPAAMGTFRTPTPLRK